MDASIHEAAPDPTAVRVALRRGLRVEAEAPPQHVILRAGPPNDSEALLVAPT